MGPISDTWGLPPGWGLAEQAFEGGRYCLRSGKQVGPDYSAVLELQLATGSTRQPVGALRLMLVGEHIHS